MAEREFPRESYLARLATLLSSGFNWATLSQKNNIEEELRRIPNKNLGLTYALMTYTWKRRGKYRINSKALQLTIWRKPVRLFVFGMIIITIHVSYWQSVFKISIGSTLWWRKQRLWKNFEFIFMVLLPPVIKSCYLNLYFQISRCQSLKINFSGLVWLL